MRYLLFFIGLTFYACGNSGSGSGSEYIGVHHEFYKLFEGHPDRSESEWAALNAIPGAKKMDSGHVRHPDFKTFGWHMYTSGTAYSYYDFSLLWAIGYFSYIPDPRTGKPKNAFNWESTGLIDSAHAQGCKVFLTVSNFGATANQTLLTNTLAQQTLIDSLASMLKRRNGDGVNIDFEAVPGENRDDFTRFLIRLSKTLKAQNPAYTITLAIYNVDWNKVFQIAAIDPHIDYYILMGYDYAGAFSKHAGPIAPLKNSNTWGNYSLDASVDYYLGQGVRHDKFIVALPFYGAAWNTPENRLPSRARHFLGHTTIDNIKQGFIEEKQQKTVYDSASASSYFVYRDSRGRNAQMWFDGKKALAQKFDWIKERRLAGAGFWALGFGTNDTELWTLMGEKFGKREW
ncbi:MAG: hypothetical protein H6574_23930 [Lewinellaceae bacterium]|nr:hypothetical protein [Saprospiraceae bacterium]MCB9334115.1 hypothetical protein [Lewinellaceae bacterium]